MLGICNRIYSNTFLSHGGMRYICILKERIMTSIEWLINQLHKKQNGDYSDLSYNQMFDQAKEMHRAEQISQLEEIVSRLEEDGLYALQGIKDNIESLKKDS